MTTYSDNFTGATAAPPSADWELIWGTGPIQRDSGTANGGTTLESVTCITTAAASFGPKQTVGIDVLTPSNFDWGGPAVRMSTTGGGQGYYVAYQSQYGAVGVVKVLAGTATGIGDTTLSWASGDRLEIEVDTVTGNAVIKVFKIPIATGIRTQVIADITDSTSPILTGQPGLYYGWGDIRGTKLDNFYATDNAVSGVATAWIRA